MDNTVILAVTIIAITLVIIVALFVHYIRTSCKNIVRVCPTQQCPDTPAGICLMDCDQISDVCYRNCDPKDEICVRGCYQLKAECYMKCLGPPKETFGDCGCNL